MTEQTQQTQTTAATEQTQSAQSNAELNFSRLRKQLETERQQNEELRSRLEQLERVQLVANERLSAPVDEEEESEDPYVDHKALKKKFSRWEQSLEQKIDQKAAQKAAELMEREKETQYIRSNPDFYDTMTPEKIDEFAKKHPAIVDRLMQMPANFHRQALLFEQMKVLNNIKKEEAKPSIQETIDRNRRTPYYHPSSVGTAPYGNTGDFSAGGQKSAYQKMQELKARIKF